MNFDEDVLALAISTDSTGLYSLSVVRNHAQNVTSKVRFAMSKPDRSDTNSPSLTLFGPAGDSDAAAVSEAGAVTGGDCAGLLFGNGGASAARAVMEMAEAITAAMAAVTMRVRVICRHRWSPSHMGGAIAFG